MIRLPMKLFWGNCSTWLSCSTLFLTTYVLHKTNGYKNYQIEILNKSRYSYQPVGTYEH